VSHADLRSRHLQQGDLVLEKSGGGEFQPVGRAVRWDLDQVAVPSNFAARIRPSADTSSRFLVYLLDFLYNSGVTRKSTKQTTGIQNLDLSIYLDEVVKVPCTTEQEAIANFLDAETARIDALAAKKRRMIELLTERRASFIENVIRGLADQYGEVRLKTAASSITVGIVVTPSAWYSNGCGSSRGRVWGALTWGFVWVLIV
jgi:type I restriction enzyme S subunit